jgi:hypothetical protein
MIKIDKEVLIKHHFWILSGTVVPLALFALIWLPTAVSGDNDDCLKKITDAEKAQKNVGDVKNDKFEKALGEKNRVLVAQKNKIWKEVWEAQKSLFTLPSDLDKVQTVPFGGSISEVDSNLPSIYERIYEGKEGYVNRVYEKEVPIAPTQFAGLSGTDAWKRSRLIRYVEEWKERPPDDEEIWLAQEDVWVQRELLRAIRQTNEGVAWFTPLEETQPAKLPADVQAARRFRSPYWQLDLQLKNGKLLTGTLTNVSKRRQPLNAAFWVQLFKKENPKEPFHINMSEQEDTRLTKLERDRLLFSGDRDRKLFVEIHLTGDTLGVGKSRTFEKEIQGRPDGLFSVFQQLKLETVPVKNLQDLRLGYHSERMSSRGALRARDEGAAASAHAARPGGGGGAPGGSFIAPPAGGAAPPGGPAPPAGEIARVPGGEKGDSGGTTKNGLERKRYMEATPQVRRMPVAMVVLVEQDHIQDLLRSLANSKLRIQTTQVSWTHAAAAKPGDVPAKTTPGPAGPGRPGGPGTPGGLIKPAGTPGPGGPAGPGGPGASAKTPSTDDQESNVVQLVFYGIISLYEQPPTK